MTANDYENFSKNTYKCILRMDVFIYRSFGKLFGLMPGDDKNLSGFLFLCVISFVIARADIALGWAISIRPLFVFPVLLASIYLSRTYAYALAVIAALLRVESFRVSMMPDGEAFPFFLNFFPAFLACIALAEFGALATTTIRELLDYIDVLHDELAVERIAGLEFERMEEEERAKAEA